MNNATKLYASTFGAIMALAGIEHGIGEMLQGNVRPSGVMIQSWPEAEFFRNLSGEPAMTLIPNMLITGVLAVFASLALIAWSVWFVHRKNGGQVMILLFVAMLLVGGGIFPPILGILIGVVATRINSPLTWWRAHLTDNTRRFLTRLWPWTYATCIISWLAMLPGAGLVGRFFASAEEVYILTVGMLALVTLILTIFTGFACDINAQTRRLPGQFTPEAV